MAYQTKNITETVISLPGSVFHPVLSSLLLLFLLSLNPPASAQSGNDFSRLLTPIRGRPEIVLDAEAGFYPSSSIGHEDNNWRLYEHKTSFNIPLPGGRNKLWSTGLNYRQLNLSTEATLPMTPQTALPSRLYAIEFNLSYRRLFQNGHSLGLVGSIGSASDQPFHSQDEIDLNLLGMWQFPSEQNQNWLLFLSYASRRPALNLDHIPLPGIAHLWRTEKGNWLMLGIPASAMEREILPEIKFSIFYMPIRNLNASITWKPYEKIGLFTRFNWENDKYWRAGRKDSDKSLNINHKKISVGCRWLPLENLSVETETGMVFSRSVYEAEKYSKRSDNRLEIEDGWFTELRGDWRF